MASDTGDSTDLQSVLPPLIAAKGERRDAQARPAWIESGVFVETTPAGHLARVVGPGDLIQDAGVWMTEGRYRGLDGHGGDPDPLDAAVERRTTVLKARLDCLMSHSSLIRLADILAAIHAGAGEKRLVVTQQELAELAGLRRATVNECLQALQDRRIVTVGRGRVDILDPEGLAGAACGCGSVREAFRDEAVQSHPTA